MGERKLFGTDGIRGRANIYPMTCEVAMTLGRAVTSHFQKFRRNKQPLIIVGKDTRLSCYMLEMAFASGVCSQGGQVILTGPLPTPAIAFITTSRRADAGVMISASHNSYDDNGIKIFDAFGYKLPDEVELELEKMVLDPSLMNVRTGPFLGNAKRFKEEVFGRYVVRCKSAFPSKYDLSGMRIVLDCANGAGYRVAPMMFTELGAEVLSLGVHPNGKNINEDCGSLHPEEACQSVHKYRADLGICLDGDGDRLVIIDENGQVVDGDKLIAISAKLLLDQGKIKKGDIIAGTVMSNLGLEVYLNGLGLGLHRTKVGDRYIMEYMRESGVVLGGEPSGHLIFAEHSTTGDGSLAALKIIECMKYYNKSISELMKDVALFPQVLKNAVVQKKVPLETVGPVQEVLKKAGDQLGDKGRVLIRYSGTEPLARVMVEGENSELVEDLCEELVQVVSKELA